LRGESLHKPTAVAEWAGLLSGFRPDCCPVIPVRRMLDGTGPCWRMLAILRPFELADWARVQRCTECGPRMSLL